MPFVEGGIVVDAEPQQQAAPTATQGGFVQGGIEVDPTPEDSYNKVLQYQAAQTDYTPTKQEYLDYLKVSKEKPLLGERPMETVLTAAGQTAVDIAKMPYRLGEAIGQYIEPPEGVMPMDVAAGTAAEIAIQSRLKAEAMARGGYDVALSNLEKLTGKLRSDDDRYEAFLATSEIKRQLARANAPEDQRVPAAQEFLQAYNIPQEAISQPGLEVGGFLADPSSIAFAGGGKAASALLQRAAPLIPRAGAALQRGGERITAIGQAPEAGAGALTTAVTGSPAMGQAVQEAISKGTTGVALGEAAGLPITATMNVPGLGTVSRVIGGTKAAGATMETLGEAGAISGGQTLTPIQRGLLGAGERIAAAEGASAGARAFGTALARSGIEAPAIGASKILIPTVGAGVGGGLLAGLTGEEGDAIAAAIGSGFAFGAIDSGFRLAKAASSDALNANRVRRTAVNDLNTRPTEVQFTYIDPTTGSEQLSTIKDAESRAKLYASLDNKQLTKALSEVAGAEAGGAEVIFHGNADAVPASLQGIDYAGVAIGPNNIKSGKPTILINVDRAKPETLPHEILHAKITSDVLSQLGSQVIESSVQSPEFQRQFTDFANRYADKLDASGAMVTADRIRTELRDAFDPTQQRAQRIENLKRMTDEFAAYYTQEFLKGKDPKTLLPGRIPSFFELAFNNAKEAVAERFTRQALQNGFDPVARTFYDANGKRIKIPWMEDAIKNLISPKEGFEPTEQKVDTRKMTQAQQNALIMARGYSDLFMTAPDGSIVRPLTKAELAAKTADVANRTMKVIETVPQNERTSVSGLDAKGNPVIEGRLSLAEADALSKSGIFSPSTSRYIVDIATAIRDGTLMEGRYWKVYGPTGKSGVFGESEKLFLPYGISINSKGGVNVKAVDWGKVQARMYKALTKPAYKNLFRTYDQAMSTLKDVYLKNIAEQNAVPSAEALGGGIEGAKKRNFFNEVMGAVPKKGDVMINLPTAGYEAGRKGGSVYQDLRIERIQNANLTGNKIPWSGDMGEQSSYRRTQLNFQPAETIGETQVSTDQNGGYRILSKNGKFRLYGPDGSTVGIFDTEGQAKLKAEKDYATQARLQPEVRQQQYTARDEGRQTAEAGRGDRPERGPQGREEGRQELGQVRQAGDVRFMPDGKSAGLAVLDNELTLDLPKRPKVLEIANAFQKLFGKAIEYRKAKPEENARLVNLLVQEIQRAVQLHPEAKGWYDENIKLTMDVMRELDPDLAKPENDFIFKVILAATSDGNKVGPQFQQTWKEYSNWKNTGKISGDFVSGDRIENIKTNLEMFTEMVDAIGWEKTKDFFTRKGTVKELRKAVVDTFKWSKKDAQGIGSSERVDEVVPFAVVLGPKLGSFFNNLYGDFSSVTMDRWFMRTIGRLTGSQVAPLPRAKVREMRNNLRGAVARLTPSEFELLGIKRGDLKGTAVDATATTIANKFGSKELRIKSAELAATGQTALEETRKFANALKKGLNPLIEAPVDGTHRRWIRERIAEVQKDLRSRGIELENADLQAVLWYLEKELYEKLNYRSKSGESDYASAASSVYRDVAGRPSDVYARGTGRVRAIGGDGRGMGVGEAQEGRAPRQIGASAAEAVAARYLPAGGERLYEPTSEQPGRRRDRGEGRYSSGNLAPLAGAPQVKGVTGPDPSLVGVAEKYARDNGIDLRRQSEYVQVDENRARRIAKAYDEMAHAPQDPKVREAYQDLIRQTTEQYRALDSAGYKFWFTDINSDAGKQYASSPFNALRDLRENKSMGIFPTDSGFGTKEDFNPESNPLLADTGLRWPFGGPNGELRTVYANDLFRAVHDAFGHGLEGSGFRAQGEENAWQAHIRLFTGPARGALTSETRGQNSWLNYGPYGERNRTAKTEDTVFADQKTGLMPEWTWTEGVVGDEPIASQRYMPSDTDYLSAVQKGDTQAAQRMVDEAARAAGYTVGPVYHGTPTGGFNVFDKRMRGETSGVSRQAFSFTTNQKAAENYSKRLGDEAVRLDAGLRVANDAMRRFDDDVAAQEYFSSKGYTSVEDGMLPEFDWGAIEDVPEFIKELRGYAKDLKPINPDLASSFIDAAKVMSSTKAVPEVKRVFLRIPENAPVFQATPSTLGMVMRDFSAEREPTKAGIVELPGNERIYYVADSSQVKLADPVTKDAQGNVIPLSKRFQASSEDIRYMPQPDSSMPGAYSFRGGYRALPGKAKGSLRLYGPAGSLIGIAASLDEAQRIIRRKTRQ